MLILALFIGSILFMTSLGLLGVYDIYINHQWLDMKKKVNVGIFIAATFGMALWLTGHMYDYYKDADMVSVTLDEEFNEEGEQQ